MTKHKFGVWVDGCDYPTDGKPVLVSVEGPYSAYMTTSVWRDDNPYNSDVSPWSGIERDERVTHWMPLPPHPTEIEKFQRVGKSPKGGRK